MDEYRELISVLPLDTVEFAFAYGSGAIHQKGENINEKMVDFIVVSNDTKKFHIDNTRKNPYHYSLLRIVGPGLIEKIQTNFAARVYYNTHVRVGGRLIKYGVISYENLKQDLLDWRWIYAAGRLHKPVLEVIKPTEEMSELILANRVAALHTSLLLLPESFSIKDLLHKIVGLSYMGDFRMVVGEDKKKIEKIVDGNFPKLLNIYEPLINDDARIAILNNKKIAQDGSTAAMYHRLSLLPSEVLNRIQFIMNKTQKRQQDQEEIIFSLAHRHYVPEIVEKAIGGIIKPISYTQTLKNAFSAGFTKSFAYSLAKITKMLKSK